MADSARASRVEWRSAQGMIVIYGERADGQETEGVALPFPTLHTLSAYAQRYVLAADAAADRPGWRTEPVMPGSCGIGLLPTRAGERVCVTFDQGLDTEIAMSLDAKAAREIGRRLLDLAARLESRPPRAN